MARAGVGLSRVRSLGESGPVASSPLSTHGAPRGAFRSAMPRLPLYFHGVLFALAGSFALASAAAAKPPIPAGRAPSAAQTQQARALLERCRPVDLHADSLWRLRTGRATALCGPGSESLQASVDQLESVHYDAQVYAVYTVPNKEDGVAAGASALSAWDREVPRCARLQPVLARSLNQPPGPLVRAVLAIEGGEALGGRAEALRQFRDRGLLSISPVWNSSNAFGDAAMDAPLHGGLSAEGRKLVGIANELGVLMDASHAAQRTIADLIATSRYPVIATHSNARAIHDHRRNLTDAQVRAIAQSGGVIGLNAHCPFVAPKGRCDARALARHGMHLRQIGGDKVLALGLDFDGGIRPPHDLRHSGQLHRLVEELLIAGMPEPAVCGLLGENVRRLMSRVATVTAQHTK